MTDDAPTIALNRKDRGRSRIADLLRCAYSWAMRDKDEETMEALRTAIDSIAPICSEPVEVDIEDDDGKKTTTD